MNRLTERIFYVSNTFHNTNVQIHEILFISPPPYYLDQFEKYYLNVSLNKDDVPFYSQYMNIIQGNNSLGWQRNQPLHEVVKILKHKKTTIGHAIYIKVFSDGTVPYITVSTDDVLDYTNKETDFIELRHVFEKYFTIKVKEGYVLK